MRAHAIALALLAPALAACSGTNDGFKAALARGDRAKTAGRYDEAALAYREAAEAAKKPADRAYGYYLEAATYQQAGRVRDAMAAHEAMQKALPADDKVTRSRFDRALLEIEHGDRAAGWAMLEATTLEHPEGATARRALRAILDNHEQKAKGAALAWLEGPGKPLAQSPLSEDYLYLRARNLEAAGRNAEAREAYRRCATEHPYPGGSLFDDSLFHASEMSEKLGDHQGAVADLRRMLSVSEGSSLGQGSNNRPLFPKAQLRIATLYRDRLNDPAQARREMRKLAELFPKSSLVPPTLFDEALLARKLGDNEGACDAARSLVKVDPESRYAACAPELCPGVSAPPKAIECRAYLRDRIAGRPSEPDTE